MFAPSPKVYILLRVSDMIFILEAQPTDQIDIKHRPVKHNYRVPKIFSEYFEHLNEHRNYNSELSDFTLAMVL